MTNVQTVVGFAFAVRYKRPKIEFSEDIIITIDSANVFDVSKAFKAYCKKVGEATIERIKLLGPSFSYTELAESDEAAEDKTEYINFTFTGEDNG